MRREELARICPAPATPAELDAAADLAIANPGALPLVRRFSRFDQESRICRSKPAQGGV